MNRLTWDEIEITAAELADQIRQSGFRPDYIIGITTGGLFPTGLLAKELKIKNILTVTARSNNDRPKGKVEIIYIPKISLEGKSALLVDDVIERGFTLKTMVSAIKKSYRPKELKTASLVKDVNKCKYAPDYFVIKQQTDWVIFPWEKEEFGPYSI